MERKATALLIAATVMLLSGCGEQPTPEPAAETPEDAEPQTVELSDTIVLPDGWEMADAMSTAEIEALVGVTGYDTWHEPLSDAAAGKPQLSWFDANREGSERPGSKINFLVYTFDGTANFDRVSGYVNDSVEVEGDLWDRAILGTMGGGIDEVTVGMLIQRGDVCIRIKWNPEIYAGFDRQEFSVKLAEQLISNLYGGPRTL
ncbi:MAG: hypothetical protein R6V62_10080 [Candidatus Fermentibacteraceae bacterium]